MECRFPCKPEPLLFVQSSGPAPESEGPMFGAYPGPSPERCGGGDAQTEAGIQRQHQAQGWIDVGYHHVKCHFSSKAALLSSVTPQQYASLRCFPSDSPRRRDRRQDRGSHET